MSEAAVGRFDEANVWFAKQAAAHQLMATEVLRVADGADMR